MDIQRQGADAEPCFKGSHRDICDHGELLRGNLPTTSKKLTVRIIQTNQEGEEGVYTVLFSVLVDTEKCQAHQAGGWGRLSGESPQEGMNPPSLT